MKSNPSPKSRRSLSGLRLAVIATLFVGAAALFAQAVDDSTALTPSTPQAEPDYTANFEGTNLWFVELKSPPLVKGSTMARLNSEKQAFRAAAANAGVVYTERFAFHKLWNGFSVEVDRANLSTLTRLPGVKAVYPVDIVQVPKTETGLSPELATAIAMTGADIAQNSLGKDGTGIKVGVMDTGIDYDHADLGGDGVARSNSGAFPNSRVVVGWDFVGDNFNASSSSPFYQPVPQPDGLPDDCNGHGSHVAGIVGASGNIANGGLRGVAPGVTFGAYRVFGCEGSTTADIMVAAMERAYDDGMHVLNMSIGSAFMTWPQYPTASVATTLVEQGMVVVASIGNSGANGLYSAGAPGVGTKVIGVASVDNSHVRQRKFTITPDDKGIGYNQATGAPTAPTSGTVDMARTGTATSTADACDPLPPGSLTGKVALIRRGTCGFNIKSINAENAGAVGVVIYNNVAGIQSITVAGPPAPTIPVVSISAADGVLINDRLAAGPVAMTWTNDFITAPNATGGLISSFSSYGLAAELDLKPDLSAPGGLIRSTYPLENGGYATISGTSMASPHVAGAVALMLQAKGWISRIPAQAESIRGLLQNTAVPGGWQGNPAAGLDQVHRQGAGLLKIDKAILAPVSVAPGKLVQGEAAVSPLIHTLTLTNNSTSAITYDLAHQPALSTFGSTFAPSASTFSVTPVFSAASVAVPAGGTASVNVTIPRPDAGATLKRLYGGYIRFTPQGGGQVLRVPYAGLGMDYQAIPVLTGGGTAPCGGTNEVQSVSISGAPTGGSFTLSFTPPGAGSAQTTAPIAFNATAANVQAALAALPGIGAGNVTAAGGPLPAAVNVTFTGTLGCQDQSQMTTTSALTGGTSPAAAVATVTNGAAAFPKLARWEGWVEVAGPAIVSTYSFPQNPVTYTMEKSRELGRQYADIPVIAAHFDHQARLVKMRVLDAAGNPVVSGSSSQTLDPVAMTVDLMSRNSTAGGFFTFEWDGRLVGTLKNGSTYSKNMPNGTYKLRLEVEKALAEKDVNGNPIPAHVETYTSPTFTIARP